MRQYNDDIMDIIQRDIEKIIYKQIQPGKVIIVTGARRVGKTFLIKQILEKLDIHYLLLNGEDINT
ncbi:unnamed protein product, partial [marine sediment metagenome]